MRSGKHHFRRALLINHVNCGAYGDSPPGIDEVDVHRADLLDAKRTLEGRYEGLDVDAYLATIVYASVVIVPMCTSG